MTTIELKKVDKLTHANCGGKLVAVALTDTPSTLMRCVKCGAEEYVS